MLVGVDRVQKVATTRRRYKGKLYETHFLRRTYRDQGKVKHQTVGNISHLPPDLIETIRRRLRGDLPPASPRASRSFAPFPTVTSPLFWRP